MHTTTSNAYVNHAPRRGSVLIFALAILAVLALLGATYVTRANLDRVSAEAAVRRSSLSQQPEIVIDHARALLTADLFGNKIVTPGTPFSVEGDQVESAGGSSPAGSVEVWPTMFEDGEHWDYPSVDEVEYTRSTSGDDRFTFARPQNSADSLEDEVARSEARLRYIPALGMFETARPDDAWLSASEPVDFRGDEPLGSYNGGWNTWSQITNPRSAYTWVANADDADHGAWVRADGRYADLALFFNTVDALDRERGDPSADLLDRANDQFPFYDPADVATEVLNLDRSYNSPLLGVEQREIYGLQMNQLAERYEFGASFNPDTTDAPFEPVDERFWADTDGDGRPDARWSIIDNLDGKSDMRWVVAMRIADSSAAINANTSVEALPRSLTGGVQGFDAYGDGATPMDIDLARLFYETATTPLDSSAYAGSGDLLRHPDIRNIDNAFVRAGLRRHFQIGLGLTEYTVASTDADAASMTNFFAIPGAGESNRDGLRDFIGWRVGFDDNFRHPGNDTIDFPTTRAQREAYWRLFAARPENPYIAGGQRYGLKEEIDLRAVFGANFAGVKGIESSFDGSYTAGFSRLPGALATPYPDRFSLGPMRSAEHSNAVSRDDLMNVDLPDGAISNSAYSQSQRIERIQKDVRRSITVASGASARSVVPALGQREVLPGRLKPLVNEGTWVGTEFQPALSVFDAFEAFTWALAPLATNRPLMGALATNWVTRYEGQYAKDPDFHYGGGASGPAIAWAAEEPALPAATMGPTYALFRAASLAVNLKDAVDDEGDSPTPTIARFFPAPEPRLPTVAELAGAEVLTTRLAQGDIDDADNPTGNGAGYVPATFINPDFGVTFVGLDRQPFISKAVITCLYEYESPTTYFPGNMPDPLPVADNDKIVGRSIVAVELINPWDTAIDLAEYSIVLSDAVKEIDMSLATSSPAAVIDPGSRLVIVWSDFEEDDTLFGTNLDSLYNKIQGDYVSLLPDAGFTSPFDDVDRPFASWRSDKTGVLLKRSTDGGDVLVDRLTRTGTEPFPYAYNAANAGDFTEAIPDDDISNATDFGVYFGFASILSRPSDSHVNGGFPAEVLERPDLNLVEEFVSSDDTSSFGWVDGTRPAGEDQITLVGAEWTRMEELGQKGTHTGLTTDHPFSLFVPDSPLIALSELGQLSAFAHTYIHASSAAPIVEISDVELPAAGSPRWATVSEQLGKPYHLSYDAASAAVDNPYLGVLDPTRFILGAAGDLNTSGMAGTSDTNLANLPDALAVPLATRVYDAFEVLADALTDTRPLVEGRININTAPKRVLAALPLVLPVDYQAGMIPTALSGLMKSTAYARLNAMLQYRERLGEDWDPNATLGNTNAELSWANTYNSGTESLPEALTNLDGLRVSYSNAGAAQAAFPSNASHRKGRGFSSIGELSVLGEWGINGAPPTSGDNRGFLELADDSAENNMLGANETRNALDVRRALTFDIPAIEATDDVEERLAIFRAVSNLTSTRSDVYHVWYVARAYSPAAIEAVEVPPTLSSIEERAELLNDLPIAYEERGFVVLDRSNVRRPTDRPRVLMRVVLETEAATN